MSCGSLAFRWCRWVNQPINQSHPHPRLRIRLSVCSGSTRLQEWELWTIGALNGLLGAMSETTTLDLKNLSFMNSDSRIFGNPLVVHSTIIVFISHRQYKAIELYEDGFLTWICFHPLQGARWYGCPRWGRIRSNRYIYLLCWSRMQLGELHATALHVILNDRTEPEPEPLMIHHTHPVHIVYPLTATCS